MIRLVVLGGVASLPQGFGQVSPAFLHLLFVVSWLYRCIIVKAYYHNWKRKQVSINWVYQRIRPPPPQLNVLFLYLLYCVHVKKKLK